MDFEELKKIISGEVIDTQEDVEVYSRDASIFEVEPKMVIKPKGTEDLKTLVKFVAENKQDDPDLSLTARAGGTDMSGGPLNDSIIVDFGNFNKIIEVEGLFQGRLFQGRTLEYGWAVAEPGVYYRDLEKATLAKGLLLPSYPASRDICTVGGMVANNAGGEKTLRYGKTNRYVEELSVVLKDGEEHLLKPLTADELEQKKSQNDFEGNVYKSMHELIETNYDLIQREKPKVSKNSAGYALWDVWNREVFDLTQLFTGSQGTLGLITKIKFKLVKPSKYSKMLVMFLKDLDSLGQIVTETVKYGPESLEAYDDNTLKLAIKFFPDMLKKMKTAALPFFVRFLPDLWMIIKSGGMPKLVLLAELTGDDEIKLESKIETLREDVSKQFKIVTRIASTPTDIDKYWAIRRESFNLLRQHAQSKKTVPFIDDIIVGPENLSRFLPELNSMLRPYTDLVYTLAGHAGDGNFHIIPLMNMDESPARQTIQELSEKVYNLVNEYGGSITAEHNDGLIRTSYLGKMFENDMIKLFEKTKYIFDPQNIFNPRKKVGGDIQWAMEHIKKWK